MTLTKAIIAATLQDKGFSNNDSDDHIESILRIIKRTLASGEDVMITEFGRFCIKKKQARKGRNPATGKDLFLRQRKIVTFKCSKNLRKRING